MKYDLKDFSLYLAGGEFYSHRPVLLTTAITIDAMTSSLTTSSRTISQLTGILDLADKAEGERPHLTPRASQ